MRRSVLLIALLFLAVLPLARCDGTILNEQVTLDAFSPTKSYFLNLAGGNTISMKISATGDLVSFFVFNSTDGQLVSRYDIGNLDEQWTVPCDDRFEFHVETPGTQATVTITLSSEGGQQSGGTLVDENVTITPPEDPSYPYISGKDYYINLTAGERISMKISATGSRINFRIYNSTDRLYEKDNITSLNEEWAVPGKDTYDFWIFSLEGTSQVHVTLQKVGSGGFDPTLLIIIVVVVVFAVVAAVLIMRMRKGSLAPPPPPPPPPPPT